MRYRPEFFFMKNRCVGKRAVSKIGYAISVWVFYARKVSCFGPRNSKRTPIVLIPLPLDSFFRDEQLSCWTLFEICPRRAPKWQISEMTPEIGPFCNFRKLLYIRHKFALFTNQIRPNPNEPHAPPAPNRATGFRNRTLSNTTILHKKNFPAYISSCYPYSLTPLSSKNQSSGSRTLDPNRSENSGCYILPPLYRIRPES